MPNASFNAKKRLKYSEKNPAILQSFLFSCTSVAAAFSTSFLINSYKELGVRIFLIKFCKGKLIVTRQLNVGLIVNCLSIFIASVCGPSRCAALPRDSDEGVTTAKLRTNPTQFMVPFK